MTRRLALAILISAGCHRLPSVAPPPPPSSGPRSAGPVVGEVRSNVLRSDYAGSEACKRCHAEIWDQWAHSPMHQMTRLPTAAATRAPFDGTVFHFKDDSVRLESHDSGKYMRLESAKFGSKWFRVTKLIGGHHREDFAGVEVSAPGAPPVGDPHAERVLPVSFILATGALRYKGYSVMVRERPGIKAGGAWSKACIFCHNTVPFLSTLFGALAPGSKAYQGEVVDVLLPAERRWSLEITDGAAFERAIAGELDKLGGRRLPGESAPLAAVRVTRANFNETHLLEVGIGCESCHGGSREHVAHVGVSPSYEPRAEFLRLRAPSESRAQRINRVCARCHQVLFSRYPYTWEGGLRAVNPGGSNINSGEARDFLLGGCAGELSCVACHDPHAPDNRRRMDELDGAAGDRICAGCHKQLAAEDAVRAHTHHRPDGAGARCLGCHMPRKNMSLDSRLTRYHRIGSPTDPARVEKDRPLECALCHADQSIARLVETMESWWHKSYDRSALRALYGVDLNQNVLLATLKVGKPHEQAAAMGALGEHDVKAAAPAIAAQLTHEYPIVRFYARAALERLLGRPVDLDLHEDDEKIRAAVARLLGAPAVAAPPAPMRPGDPDDE